MVRSHVWSSAVSGPRKKQKSTRITVDKIKVPGTLKGSPKEAQIVLEIEMLLRMFQIPFWRMFTGPRMVGDGSIKIPSRQTGMSDIIGVINGRFLAIEVKRPGGYITRKQLDFVDTINSGGGIAFIATSKEDVRQKLEPLLSKVLR